MSPPLGLAGGPCASCSQARDLGTAVRAEKNRLQFGQLPHATDGETEAQGSWLASEHRG